MSANISPQFCHWLQRHQAGDPDARPEVIRHGQSAVEVIVRRLARRHAGLRNREEVRDICQNVLVRLDRVLQARSLDGPTAFLRLSTCLTRRELIDLSRRHHAAGRGLAALASECGRPAEEQPDESASDPLTLVIWEEVHARIAALPDDDRRLFDLLYYRGLTQPEAATELGLPLRTLKRKWQELRRRLVGALGNEPPF